MLILAHSTNYFFIRLNIRLEGGAAFEEASSSGSLPRLRPPCGGPRFAADMLLCSGELWVVSDIVLEYRSNLSITSCGMCVVGEGLFVLAVGNALETS